MGKRGLPNMTFQDYSESWQQQILVLHQPATQVVMRSHINKLNNYFGQMEVNRLESVQEFFTKESKSLAPKSIKNLWGTMRLVLTQAQRDGLIEKVPEPTLPKVRRHQQPWLTAEEMKKIIKTADYRDSVMYHLLAETGLRIGEAAALGNKDIRRKDNLLIVNKSVFSGKVQVPKTDSANRTICVSEKLAIALAGFGDTKFLFKPNLSKFHSLLETLHIPKQGFHSFRRGNATIMATIGVPEKVAAYRLGHALPGLTFGLYAQNIQKMDEPWVEKIGEALQ